MKLERMVARARAQDALVAGRDWRYLPTGKAAHALTGAAASACGMVPTVAWMGTGSQREYETVAVLPRCRRCLRALAGRH